MKLLLLTIFAYLLGAIPFGLLIARSRGVDIRKKGSGNIGATNVLRVMGKGWGITTLLLDALKGFIPAAFFPVLAKLNPDYGLLFGTAAILGHTFPIYLRFKGGKGVATGAGMLLGVVPFAMGVGVLCWIICMVLFRYVSLASIMATLAVVLTVWIQGEKSMTINGVLTGLAFLVIWLHRSNIRRLLAGTENRFGKKTG
jgi:glycerol-3-phosphate acyltransferase PlsY